MLCRPLASFFPLSCYVNSWLQNGYAQMADSGLGGHVNTCCKRYVCSFCTFFLNHFHHNTLMMRFSKILTSLLAMAFLATVATSCTQETLSPDENLAFSSNGPGIPDVAVGGDDTFYKFKLTNGFPQWADTDGTFWLGIVADEKVRAVYIYAASKHSQWMRVDPQFGDGNFTGSFDPDAFMRNQDGNNCGLFNSDKSGMNAFGIGQEIYVTFGGKYAALRRDRGSVFRESGSTCGTFPSGISCVDYLPFPRTADFNGTPIFIGVTSGGYVAASATIGGPYQIPGIELGTPNSASDVNYNGQTAGRVTCLDVTGWKSVVFSLNDGSTIVGQAQRGSNEFIKVD